MFNSYNTTIVGQSDTFWKENKIRFIPLTDCAPLVAAKELGLFAKYGVDVELSKEAS
jgi:ABC-type nitrate/sulfonate/bicarbonate transport system substrate-binding protein